MRNVFCFSTVVALGLALGSVSAQAEPTSAQITQTDDSYFQQGQQTLEAMLNEQANMDQAKNVIIFIADGADPIVHTSARILDGQLRGEIGEHNILSFDTFPNVALVKTYTADSQVADSAPTATAWNSGVKTNNGLIGVNASVTYDNCASQEGNDVTLLFELAESAGMATGTVSTARLTHATPAANYAHTANRDWEADSDLSDEAKAQGCTDIAAQLLAFPYGDGLEVALGGGRTNFLPETVADPEYSDEMGARADGQDLTQMWLTKFENSAYVWNQEQFSAVDPATTDHLLGLFEPSHMQYDVDREADTAGEPSLTAMTTKAIDILAKNANGYVLQVEAGRVDHALHAGNAARALTDDIAFADAIQATLDKVDLNETLIIVSSDHGHTMTFAGYPHLDNPILGVVHEVGEDGQPSADPALAQDEKPYTTLGFANGPGSLFYEEETEEEPVASGGATAAEAAPVTRPAVTDAEAEDTDYLQQSLVPLESETHGGTDVAAYAIGPRASLVRGVVEQSYLFQVMDYALNLTERAQR